MVYSSQDTAWGADTERSRALSAGDEASNKIENCWSSSFWDSTLWWNGEAMIESTEITSDGGRQNCWREQPREIPKPEAQ